MPRRIGLLIFPGFQLLDAAGPVAAFEIAGRFAPGAYALQLVAAEPGLVRSSSGVAWAAEPLADGPFDTVMAAGGYGTAGAMACPRTLAWLSAEAARARRVASVCSGTYLLAEAGLLDGRAATTHWGRSQDFARRYPRIDLQPDRIFVRDGPVWTSAGITAGIDLALALVAEDLGEAVARRTAQELVVHQRRPGGQSQFSALVELGGQSGRFADLMAWMRERLHEPLGVERLADRAAMSPRHFARAFAAETGLTPAKAVERLRLEAARLRVEASAEPIDRVAETAGFGDAERMRRAFIRAFGQPPQALRRAARA
ncbi:GlxA family transcriptional regulator [Phenylobacterium sp.]|uniref:GlxA family transcriptional regulator n=1 Tax=Phenylobacterium sp. TaxID=1871053 RepID=UPI002F4123FB